MKTLMLVTALAVVPTLGGQEAAATATTPEAGALRECTALADAGRAEDAAVRGKDAELMYRKRLARDRRDVEAFVGVARAMSQCLLPSADFLRQGELTSEAMDLLDQAIAIRPDHWLARFVLASIAYRSPSFLGRGKRAAKEFDELLRLQGDRTDNPLYAKVFALRGLQLAREGQADSARALWVRGATLFPADSLLRALSDGQGQSVPRRALPDSSPAASLATVRITARATAPKAPLPSVKEVSRSQVLLAAGGAADVLQAVQMQPGATRVGEGGDVYTRGGDAMETALIVNGGRVLSLARFEGLSGSMFGAIEPFVVKAVRYSSGGFSVRHGNALSGVLEIETDGRPGERQTRAGISLVQASGTFRVPTSKQTGGWLNVRVSNTAALLAMHGRTHEFRGAPRSQEAIGSFVAMPTPLTEIRATGIVEHDDSRRFLTAAGWRGTFDSRGDTRAAILTGRWISARAPLMLRGNIVGSSRATDWAFGVLSRSRGEQSAAARADAEWQASSRLMVRAGTERGMHRRKERGAVPTTASVATGAPVRVLNDPSTSANQVGGYVETELAAAALTITTGVRADRLPGEREVTSDPRVAIAARLRQWSMRISGGVFHQDRWRGDAAIPDVGTPSGLARSARHLVVGVEREVTSSLVRAEAFVKRYADYREFGLGPRIDRSDVRGLDVIAQRLSGPVTGWMGYSLLHGRSRLSSGGIVSSPFDVTHSATGSITAALGDWSLGTTARYGSGAPHTPILGATQTVDGRWEPRYGAIMSERLPAYARLDARLMRHISFARALLTSYMEILNVTDRPNVSTFTYDPTYSSREVVRTFFARRTLVVGGEFMFR